MKMAFLPFLLLSCLAAQSQAQSRGLSSCPAHIDLEITQQAGQTVYGYGKKNYSKYPLDIIGALANRCPQTKRMYIVVDSSVPFDDILTALNGSGKNQIDQVSVFIRKNGFFLPLTLGNQSSKDPTK